ncbi:hypothetical protein CLV37_1314 [Kineococcus rhizosphaerae]|uniref:Uncharacterized protein n=1 Tax=Kineococcus rhizosphaerae TaxID=559628 RepID=A0A2T0QQ06_9ACTN|nr:hypothetical protein CLV37_1314 [Kineococcus rhizosphaerae]
MSRPRPGSLEELGVGEYEGHGWWPTRADLYDRDNPSRPEQAWTER